MSQIQRDKCAAFTKLHKGPGAFVIPNPWDVGSAKYLAALGFKALATTSAGAAWAMGRADNQVGRAAMLAHIALMAGASDLPFNADFENCFSDTVEGVGESVALCVKTGVAGLSIEDAAGRKDTPFYDIDVAVARVKVARHAIDATGMPVLLTARSEVVLGQHPGGLKEALKRITAYADAGGDVLFVPGLRSLADMKAVIDAAAPKPVNIILSGPGFSVRQIEDIGGRRISVGSSLARAAFGGFLRAAREIAAHGTFEEFAKGEPFADINGFFARKT